MHDIIRRTPLRLSAAAVAAATAFLLIATPPAAGQTLGWTPDPVEQITPDSAGDFSADPAPIQLVAPRNGVASGVVVVRNADLARVRIADLRGPGGSVLPWRDLRLRAAAQQTPHGWRHSDFDALLDNPPGRHVGAEEMLPLWVTVKVPAEAAPGTYRGAIQVDGLTVGIQVEVAGFLLPDPSDWTSQAMLIQSPEAIAWTYGAALWSDAHFQKLEPSLQLLGELGNNVVHIPVIRGLHFGNDHAMLVFRREGGRIRPDFRFVDRYLDLYARHAGAPRVLWLYLWEPAGSPAHQDAERAHVTFLDDRGRLEEGYLPMYGLGEADGVWRAVIDGMRERIARRGWDPGILMLGAGADRRPGASEVAFFNAMDPPLKWVIFSHWRGDPVGNVERLVIDNGIVVGYAEGPDPVHYHRDLGDSTRRGGGWQDRYQVLWASSFRHHIRQESPPWVYRCMPDLSVVGRYAGFTRIGLDAWEAEHPQSGQRTATLMRRRNGWFRLFRHNPRWITAPGPAGAIATVRYEMLREGIQEAEARIVLERGLESAALSEDTRERVEQFLREWNAGRYGQGDTSRSPLRFEVPSDWREQTARLFDLAGTVAGEMGSH